MMGDPFNVGGGCYYEISVGAFSFASCTYGY